MYNSMNLLQFIPIQSVIRSNRISNHVIANQIK